MRRRARWDRVRGRDSGGLWPSDASASGLLNPAAPGQQGKTGGGGAVGGQGEGGGGLEAPVWQPRSKPPTNQNTSVRARPALIHAPTLGESGIPRLSLRPLTSQTQSVPGPHWPLRRGFGALPYTCAGTEDAPGQVGEVLELTFAGEASGAAVGKREGAETAALCGVATGLSCARGVPGDPGGGSGRITGSQVAVLLRVRARSRAGAVLGRS